MLLPAVGSNWVGTNALTDSDEKELIGGLLSLMAWLREWHPAVPIIFPWVDAMVLFGSELTEVSHRPCRVGYAHSAQPAINGVRSA